MFVYKYRGVSNLERDIKSIQENQYFSSPYKLLNDSFENLFNDNISNVLKLLESKYNINTQNSITNLSIIKSFNEKMGIYSLTNSPYNELMWAHYADANKGFCIEYDYNKLAEETNYPLQHNVNRLNVSYNNLPPTISLEDIYKGSLLKKLFGTKSISWKYEKEVRIITDTSGLITYNPQAIQAIYFGISSTKKMREKIISTITIPNVVFYQIHRKDKSYRMYKSILHINNKATDIDPNNFEFETNHLPGAENFYIKYLKEFKDEDAVKSFIQKFKKEYSSKQANIVVFNSQTDLAMTQDLPKNYLELDKHKIAEIILNSDVIFNINTN